MIQKKGYFSISGDKSEYGFALDKIKNNSIFDITFARYSVYLDRVLQGDTYEGYFIVGRHGESTYPRRKFTSSSYYYDYTPTQEINLLYKRHGISAIMPIDFNSLYRGLKNIYFDISADCLILPEIKNLSYFGESLVEDIILSWESLNQDKYTVSASVNNEIVYMATGYMSNTHTIPKNTFNAGDNVKILVEVEYSLNGSLTKNASASETLSINITDTRPIITELTAKNNMLSWRGKNLSAAFANVELYNIDLNSVKVADFEIPGIDFNTNKYFIPPAIKLYDGEHLVKMTVKKDIYGVIYTSTLDTYMSVYNKPYVKINSLEPADVARNYEKAITITFDTTNQQTFNIKVFQENKLKFEKSGTSEKTLILPKNTLSDGIATIQLIITNTLYNIVKQDKKTVNFNLYGGLKPPQITTDAINNVLNKNSIKVSWNATDLQRYYRVEFDIIRLYNLQKLDTGISMDSGYHFDGDYLTLKEDSGIIRGTDTSYISKTILFKNDNIKNLKVTVYNELKESSSNVYKGVYVDYDITADTILSSYIKDDKIIINSRADMQNATFRLMRGTDERYTHYKEVFSTTQNNFVYEDDNVKSDTRYYYYIITTYDNKSAASNVVIESIKIRGFLFTNLDTNNTINLNLEVSTDFTHNDGKVIVEFLGKSTADIEQDERNYQVCNFSCLLNKNDLVEVNKLFIADKVAYRDRQGNAFVCNLMNKKISYNDKIDGYVRLSFDMIENDSLKVFE